jgi:hypothetical protein
MYKYQASASKVVLVLYWDCNGLILKHYLEQGTTVTTASYMDILKSRLKPVIGNKRRELLSKGFLFAPRKRTSAFCASYR